MFGKSIATKNLIFSKIALTMVVILLFLAVLVVVSAYKYKGAYSPVSDGSEETIDLAVLKQDYLSRYRNLVGNFLTEFESADETTRSELPAAAGAVRASLLDLKVTADLKETHLATILALTDLISAPDDLAIENDLSRLKDLLNNLSD
jgi:hypothetical protein